MSARPSKLKAALIWAGVVTVAATLLGVVYGLALSFLVILPLVERGASPTVIGLAQTLVSTVYGFFFSLAAFLILVDNFPFGRYRLRLVPKDEPVTETFA